MIDWEMKTNQGQRRAVSAHDEIDGKITAEELHASMVKMIELDLEEAKQLVEAFNVDADEASLTRDEAFNMLSKTLGESGPTRPRRQALLRRYMSSNGCVQRARVATCHLAWRCRYSGQRGLLQRRLGVAPLQDRGPGTCGGRGGYIRPSWASYGALLRSSSFTRRILRSEGGPWAVG